MVKIETVDLVKKFGEFTANDHISMKIKEGEITAIVGENGAGKTTLMNMLYGLLDPTSGKIFIDGKEVVLKSPVDAIAHGIGMVHQHFKLVPSLTVYENIMLGTEITKGINIGAKRIKGFFIDNKKEKEEVQKVIDKYNFDLNPDDVVKNISIGSKQRIEILKMLYRNVDILIFDEPTAVLTPQEVDELLESFRGLKKQGKTIILITHKLREVMEVSDQVIIIKQGKLIDTMRTADTNAQDIATSMVGREVVESVNLDKDASKTSRVIYELRNIATESSPGVKCLRNINLKIRAGEILGIAGVEGNGQSELVKVITGLMESTEGGILLNGLDITNTWPKEIRASGIGIIPEDRYAQGLCVDMSLDDNFIAGQYENKDYFNKGFLKFKEIEKKSTDLIDKYDIRISQRKSNVSSLSGGNAQKIIIAREFESNPSLLIASQPTRGVDIGSIEFIHKKILELRAQDKGILLISSDLTEIMNLSDRIAVMYKGEIIGMVNAKETSMSELGLLMAGIQVKRPEGVEIANG